ncbi:MAG: sulfotransferase [Omnitrophica bacterium]|nr:sulfotransferase [Candidatus Omnitrophota bacterium]
MHNGKLVFIIGSERSGSTLLRLLLSHHPQVYIFSDSYDFLISSLLKKDSDSLRIFNPFYRKIIVRFRNLIKSSTQPSEKIKKIIAICRKETNKQYIGIQMHRNYKLVNMAFPRAKYIHLVRDPRPVCKSMIKFRWCGNYYYAAKKWLTSISEVKNLQEAILNENFLEIKYEKLVSKTKDVLNKICKFIGIAYTDEMFDYTKYTTYSYPSAENVNNRNHSISKKDIYLVESITGETMQSYGYTLVHSQIWKPHFCGKFYLWLDNRIKRFLLHVRFIGITTYLRIKVNQILGVVIFRKADKKYTKKISAEIK